jgi:hypothetical protein
MQVHHARLACDYYPVPHSAQRVAKDGLAVAEPVEIRRIEEIHSTVERGQYCAARLPVIRRPICYGPSGVTADSPGAEADLGNSDPG